MSKPEQTFVSAETLVKKFLLEDPSMTVDEIKTRVESEGKKIRRSYIMTIRWNLKKDGFWIPPEKEKKEKVYDSRNNKSHPLYYKMRALTDKLNIELGTGINYLFLCFLDEDNRKFLLAELAAIKPRITLVEYLVALITDARIDQEESTMNKRKEINK